MSTTKRLISGGRSGGQGHASRLKVEACNGSQGSEPGAVLTRIKVGGERPSVRDALIAFMSATAQAQAEATKEAQRAGIAHARARDDAYRGRKPSYTRSQLDTVRAQLAQGASVSAVARDTGLSRQTVYRIQEDPAEAEAILARWAA